MANKTHLAFLEAKIKTWNKWRTAQPRITPNLRRANLNNKDLSKYDLRHADLRNAQLRRATLNEATFNDANLQGADLRGASIIAADFSNANLKGANFTSAIAFNPEISCKNTKFIDTKIQETNFTKASLNGANFTRAKAGFFNLLGEGHLWIILWSVIFGFWSAFPAFIMLAFYLHFFGFFKRKLYFILLISFFASVSWAISVRLFLGKIFVGFTGLHIAIGTAMIFMVVVSEIVTIKSSRSENRITAKFWNTVLFVSILILAIFYMENILIFFGYNIENDYVISTITAIFGALVGAGYGAWVSNLAIKGEEFSLLWRIYVEEIASLGTSFKEAKLDDAIFDGATLTGANFIEADINRTSWWSVDDLDFIIPGDKYLKYPQIRKFFQSSSASGNTGRQDQLNCNDLKLEGINFSHQKLNNSSFWGADLSKSNLSNTELEYAVLTCSNLSGADLTQATLTGAYLKDIRYDHNTLFKKVVCDYVNLHDNSPNTNHDRFPPEDHFKPGDFENFFKKEDTLKLLIRHPYNIQAIDSVLPEIMRDFNIDSNLFQGIRRLGDNLLIEFQVSQEIRANKTPIEKRFQSKMEEPTDYQANREQEQSSDDNQPIILIQKIIRTIILNNGNYIEDIDGNYREG